MTPEHEGWGQVLQFAIPEASASHLAAMASHEEHRPEQGLSRADAAATSTPMTDNPIETREAPQSATTAAADAAHRRLVDRRAQTSLGLHLRAMYDGIAKEPVPDKLLALIDTLASKERER